METIYEIKEWGGLIGRWFGRRLVKIENFCGALREGNITIYDQSLRDLVEREVPRLNLQKNL